MKIKLVQGKHKCSCAIACLSMITGIDYDNIIDVFANNFDKQGLSDDKIFTYLSDHNFAVIQKKIISYFHKDDFRAVMVKPFAPVHIIVMRLHADRKNEGHAVVMDENGMLFDPGGFPIEFLKKCYELDWIAGIYPPGVNPNTWKRKPKSKKKKV